MFLVFAGIFFIISLFFIPLVAEILPLVIDAVGLVAVFLFALTVRVALVDSVYNDTKSAWWAGLLFRFVEEISVLSEEYARAPACFWVWLRLHLVAAALDVKSDVAPSFPSLLSFHLPKMFEYFLPEECFSLLLSEAAGQGGSIKDDGKSPS